MKLYHFVEGLYDTAAYSNEVLHLVMWETLSVPMFVMIMQKFLFICELTNTMFCQAPEETLFILVMLICLCNAILSWDYIFTNVKSFRYLYVFSWHVSLSCGESYTLRDTELKTKYCYELGVQIPLFPYSQGYSVQ